MLAALAARIAVRRSIFGSGCAANAQTMESSADNFIERCDVGVGVGATPNWEVMDMAVIGDAGAVMDAEEGNRGTVTIGRAP